jgi:hypothetical protein
MAFVQGIGRECMEAFEFWEEKGEIMYLNPRPIRVANSCGNIVKMMGSSNRLV